MLRNSKTLLPAAAPLTPAPNKIDNEVSDLWITCADTRKDISWPDIYMFKKTLKTA